MPALVNLNDWDEPLALAECCELAVGRTSNEMGESGGEKLLKQLIIEEKCLQMYKSLTKTSLYKLKVFL